MALPKILAKVPGFRRFLKNLAVREVQSLFPRADPVLVGIGYGFFCFLIGIALRLIIDRVWEGAGPFGLMVPVVLVATLFGRMLAGLVCLVLTSLYAWYAVLPIEYSFSFQISTDGPRVIVNILGGLFVVLLAELFRRTVQEVLHDRDFLLRELEHRVKNNFASVESILRLQIREHKDNPVVAEALGAAVSRVQIYSLVNSFLYRSSVYSGTVEMGTYLETLANAIGQSVSVDRNITINSKLEPVNMDREQAISVGLIVNELVTNSLKHAFAGRDAGTITIRLHLVDGQKVLEIADDGTGMSEETRTGSLGMKLVAALAQQAHAEVQIAQGESGTAFKFTFEE